MENNESGLELLPQTVEDLTKFVNSIAEEYALPDSDDTYEAVATLIMHMPPNNCFAPRSFFGDSIRKSIANRAAYTKLEEFARKRKEARLQQEATPEEHLPSGTESV